MALPANIDTGLVAGRFIVGVVDGPDPDDEPDAIPAQGTVTFTASVPYLPDPTSAPSPVTVLKVPISGVLDAEGYLCVPDHTDPSKAGKRGVRLIATDDPDLSVQGWTWTVSYAFQVVNGVRPQIATHSIAVPSGSTVDLTTVMKVPSSAGIGTEQAEALAASATNAALEAAASAELAGQAAHPTDEGTATLVTYGGQTTAALDTQYRRDVTPGMFGAAGDGLTDDTAAVDAAIQSGAPVNWGGHLQAYRITAPLTMDLSAPLSWRSVGASIVADFPQPAERMLTINANGHAVTIDGPLILDAARTAFTVFRAWNRGAPSPACILTDLTALNGHRASTAFPGGDGIVVGGSWDRVSLIRPTVKNMTLAAGAGVPGSYGVGGIYVHDIRIEAGRTETPHIVTISDPYVENISSEDSSYQDDQDGIKVFGGTDTPGQATPIRTHLTLTGGEVRNALGRSFKAQVEMATVDGLRVVRDAGGKGKAQDLDFQIGGGTVRNLECVYIDAAPPTVINFSGSRTAGRTLMQKQVSGLKVLVQGSVSPDYLVSILSQQEMEVAATISDVSVASSAGHPTHLVRLAGVAGASQRIALTNVMAHATTAAIMAYGGGATGWDAQISAVGMINTGTTKPLVDARESSRVATSIAGLMGYTG